MASPLQQALIINQPLMQKASTSDQSLAEEASINSQEERKRDEKKGDEKKGDEKKGDEKKEDERKGDEGRGGREEKGRKKKEDPTIVFIDGGIKQLAEIDAKNQSFQIRMHLYFTWVLNEEDEKSYIVVKATNDKEKIKQWEPGSIPIIDVRNSINHDNNFIVEHYDETKKYQIRLKDGKYSARCRREFNLICTEVFELDNFPFDCQDLSIHMRLEKNSSEYKLAPNNHKGKPFLSINSQDLVLTEYKLTGMICEFFELNRSRNKEPKSCMVIRLKLKRNWRYYIWRVVIFVSLFSVSSLIMAFSFSNDENMGERQQILTTMLLANITYLYVIQNDLPKISSLTFLDKYIIFSFVFIFLIIAQTCYISYFNLFDHDIYFLYFFIFLWITIHIEFTRRVFQKYNKELEKLQLDSIQLKRHFEQLSEKKKKSCLLCCYYCCCHRYFNKIEDTPPNIETEDLWLNSNPDMLDDETKNELKKSSSISNFIRCSDSKSENHKKYPVQSNVSSISQ